MSRERRPRGGHHRRRALMLTILRRSRAASPPAHREARARTRNVELWLRCSTEAQREHKALDMASKAVLSSPISRGVQAWPPVGEAGLSLEPQRRGAPPNDPGRRERSMAMHEGQGGIARRAFLRVASAAAGAAVTGGIPAIVAAQKAPSFPKGTKLNILEWVSFVPASDVEVKRLAAEFGKLAGVDVTVDQINMNDLNPRITSAIETKAGPDIIMMISNWPHLYADGLADVDDVAEEIRSEERRVGKECRSRWSP